MDVIGYALAEAAERVGSAAGTWAYIPNNPAGNGGRLYSGNTYDPVTKKWYVLNAGQSGAGEQRAHAAYDPATNTWTTKAQGNYYLSEGAAGVGNGKVYGFQSSITGEVEVYDPATNTWTYPFNTNSKRTWPHAANIPGGILLAGGYDGNGTSSTVAFLNTTTNTLTGKAAMPSYSHGFAAAYLPKDGTQGAVYVARNASWVLGDTNPAALYRYDVAANTWSTLTAFTAPIKSGTGAEGKGRFYLIGYGNTDFYTGAAACAAYDTATGTWTTGVAGLNKGRAMATAGYDNHGSIWVAQGFGNGSNDATATAEKFAAPPNLKELLAALKGYLATK